MSDVSELTSITATKVKKIIKDKRLKPGDKLPSEAEIGEMFGVSRPTVREAMKILKAEQIIEIQRGKGTFVKEQTGVLNDPLGLNFVDQKHLVKNLLEARLMIEPNITCLAAQKATEKDLYELGKIIDEIKKSCNHSEHNADLDMRFHMKIAQCSQNEVLYRVMPLINESIVEGYEETVNNENSFKRSIESHINIFEAIKNKDYMRARYEVEKHIRQTLEDINKLTGG